jgi:hypothetical protein
MRSYLKVLINKSKTLLNVLKGVRKLNCSLIILNPTASNELNLSLVDKLSESILLSCIIPIPPGLKETDLRPVEPVLGMRLKFWY